MRKVLLTAATALLAACSIPYATPEQTIAVPYATFVPNAAGAVTLPLVPGFTDVQTPAASFPVPPEAKTVKLETLNLVMRLRNTGALPLRVALHLAASKDAVYAQAPLGGADGVYVLGAGAVVEKTLPIDVALLKSDQLWLGTKVSSDGAQTPVTIKDTDKIEVVYKTTGTAKIP